LIFAGKNERADGLAGVPWHIEDDAHPNLGCVKVADNIGAKALSVTVDANDTTATVDHFTKTYGEANPAFGVRYDGFVNGDTPAALGGALAYATDATAASNTGTYDVTPSGLTSTNYTIGFVLSPIHI